MTEKRYSCWGVVREVGDRAKRGTSVPMFTYHLKRLSAIRRKGVSWVLIGLSILGWLTSGTAQADVTAAQVQRSIDRGVAYLRQSQNEQGGWVEFGGYSCGLSALCTLALLNSGVAHDDPTMVKAIRYLRGHEPKETYSIALQTLVFCQVGAAGDLGRIRRNVQVLSQGQKKGRLTGRIGAWGYGGNRSAGDPSNTQFAILALGAAQDRGVEVDPAVFERALKYWESRQSASEAGVTAAHLPAAA